MPPQIKALIIDDEPDIRELLALTLSRMNIDCDPAKDVTSAKSLLDTNEYNFCLTDMRLPDGDGFDIIQYIQQHHPRLPVAVISAHGNMDMAIEALKQGAFDFVNKPVDLQALRSLVDAAVSSNTAPEPKDDVGIVGRSPAVKQLNNAIKKVSRSQAPVYVSGESGSGKELAARAIHQLGARANKPFVPVNCGAIPAELVESEFFGYKKGSFTGATHDSEGLFQAANGGTLFLDEVADLPLSMQVKLLRAIQEKAVRPVGTQSEVTVNVRILSATHKNLSELVDKGDFRQDLYYRLNVIQLDVPPLRDRTEDITILVEHILKRLGKESGEQTPIIENKAIQSLQHYNFPGNIRELENILERAFTLCENSRISESDLQIKPQNQSGDIKVLKKGTHFQNALCYPSMDDYLAEIEKEILLDALEKDRWNKTNAASTLGISFRSFRYRLTKLGLDEQEGNT